MTYQTLEAQVASLSFHAYLHHNLVTSLLKPVFEVIMGEEYTQKVFDKNLPINYGF